MGRFLREQFPNTRRVQSLSRQKFGNNMYAAGAVKVEKPPLIGTALDYRIRFYFPQIGRNGKLEVEDLVCHRGAMHACNCAVAFTESGGRFLIQPQDLAACEYGGYSVGDPENANAIDQLSIDLVNDFFASLKTVLDRLSPATRRLDDDDEVLLLRYCVVMAALDPFERSEFIRTSALFDPKPKQSVAELLSIAEDNWLDDLKALSWDFFDNYQSLVAGLAHLNPMFTGGASVDGADADLIVDGCLIDIKTTINPLKDSQWLYQLLGYAILDWSDEYHITDVAAYFSRQRFLLKWNLNELMAELAGHPCDLAEIRQLWRDSSADLSKSPLDVQIPRSTPTAEVKPKSAGITGKIPHRKNATKGEVQQWKVAAVRIEIWPVGTQFSLSAPLLLATTCLGASTTIVELHSDSVTLLKYMLDRGARYRWFASSGTLLEFNNWLSSIQCAKHSWTVTRNSPKAVKFLRERSIVRLDDAANILPPKLRNRVDSGKMGSVPNEFGFDTTEAFVESIAHLRNDVERLCDVIAGYRRIINAHFDCEMSNEHPYPKEFLTSQIAAPWTPDQVNSLNEFQADGHFHEFMCERDHDGSKVLKATANGWECPNCRYRQRWAYEAMTNWRWLAPAKGLRTFFA